MNKNNNYYSHAEVDPIKWNLDYNQMYNLLLQNMNIHNAPITIPNHLFIMRDKNPNGALQAQIDFHKSNNKPKI